jgi:NodT family efflux transporter outer membrane factor (OMF) lipoprotein
MTAEGTGRSAVMHALKSVRHVSNVPSSPLKFARWGTCVTLWRLAACLLLMVIVPGCHLKEWVRNGYKVGPNYCRPQAPVASEWIDYRDPRVKSVEQDLSEWWRVFNDPVLDRLVESAYEQNLSLREAGARVLAARALRDFAVGNLFPQTQEAAGAYSRNKLSEEQAGGAPRDVWISDWNAGFNLSWELDFWGRFRRAVESADATLDASIENYDDVLVVLLADVATNYVQYRTFEQRLFYANTNVEIQRKSYQLAKDKQEAGTATERDTQQAKQILEQTQALIPVLETGMRQANNRLCVLLGMPPKDLADVLGEGKDIPQAPLDVAVGIPADLLRRRPDVRRAERQVAAQSAQIGIAEAEFYPHIAINGNIGLAADQFKELFDTPDAMIGSIGPSFRWSILNYGRLLANVRFQDARFQELAYSYQNSVLNAAREAEDGIIAFLQSQEQVIRLAASVEAANRTVEITAEQYRQGAVDFTPLFLFQDTLTQQQDQLAAARGNIALSLIATYRAIGGGWEMRLVRDGDTECVAVMPVAGESQ